MSNNHNLYLFFLEIAYFTELVILYEMAIYIRKFLCEDVWESIFCKLASDPSVHYLVCICFFELQDEVADKMTNVACR